MKSSFDFSRKLLFRNDNTANEGGTPLIIRIARTGIAIGVAVMLISVAIVTGFQHAIRDKISGFGAHITIANYDNNESLEPIPIAADPEYLKTLKQLPTLKHIQNISTKAGIIRVKDNIDGIILKGVGADYDWAFFKSNLVKGKIFESSDTAKTQHLLISQEMANRLVLDVNDAVEIYFIQGSQRLVRKFKVSGIYKTGFSDYDRLYALADIAHIKKLNGWNSNQTGMFEITATNFEQLDGLADEVNRYIDFDQKATTITEQRPWIFDWLRLLDTNAIIIIVLMLIVSAINSISAMLTLILEKTSEIGLLKTLGMNNATLRKVFFWGGGKIAILGIIWGNLLGIGLLILQYFTHLVKLDEANYYVNYVPVNLAWQNMVLVNVLSLFIIFLSISIPLSIISAISPLKAIKYK